MTDTDVMAITLGCIIGGGISTLTGYFLGLRHGKKEERARWQPLFHRTGPLDPLSCIDFKEEQKRMVEESKLMAAEQTKLQKRMAKDTSKAEFVARYGHRAWDERSIS